jgi:hypothetical protein
MSGIAKQLIIPFEAADCSSGTSAWGSARRRRRRRCRSARCSSPGQFADLLWPTLLLLGVERVEIQPGITAMTPLDFVSYPYSHSLVALCLWGFAVGVTYALVRRARMRAVLTLALLVVSHWVLDFVTHRPDLPLTLNGTERLGPGCRTPRLGHRFVRLA